MGIRFRKSINLGGGFKINLSKSGVGYSWGTKGYRVTKKSTGGTRTTASIYGTGLSYVSETGKKKKKETVSASVQGGTPIAPPTVQEPESNMYETKAIENSDAADMVSDGMEEMLAAASKIKNTFELIAGFCCLTVILGIWFKPLWIASIALLVWAIYYRKNNIINLEYNVDDDMRKEVDRRMKPILKIISCDKVWRKTQTSKVVDKKYSSGASNVVGRVSCTVSTKPPYPFKTDEKVAVFSIKNETLVFLPDKLLIIQSKGIGALNYEGITFKAGTTNFIETEKVPRDTTIIDHTWEYVNKSGEADKRFSDNKQLPICLYGVLEMKSASGLDTVIMFSNPNLD